jgi:hypothetical protein
LSLIKPSRNRGLYCYHIFSYPINNSQKGDTDLGDTRLIQLLISTKVGGHTPFDGG